jgi:hypothetical protein
MKIVSELKGGSLSRTQIVDRGGELFVRKSISALDNREYGLVRWQSQVRKIQLLENVLGDLIVPITSLGLDKDFYFYEMPYIYGGQNCATALEMGESPELIASEVLQILDQLTMFAYKSVHGAMSVYIAEEVEGPMLRAREILLTNGNFFSDTETKNLFDEIDKALAKLSVLKLKFTSCSINQTLTHGNLTLENILWDSKQKRLVLIDPYAETYCENINGDFSQLLQSSESGYESIVKEFNLTGISNVMVYPENTIPNIYFEFAKEIKSLVVEKSWYDEELTNVFHSSQFTRMFPFKLEHDVRQAYAFLVHGVNLLLRY